MPNSARNLCVANKFKFSSTIGKDIINILLLDSVLHVQGNDASLWMTSRDNKSKQMELKFIRALSRLWPLEAAIAISSTGQITLINGTEVVPINKSNYLAEFLGRKCENVNVDNDVKMCANSDLGLVVVTYFDRHMIMSIDFTQSIPNVKGVRVTRINSCFYSEPRHHILPTPQAIMTTSAFAIWGNDQCPLLVSSFNSTSIKYWKLMKLEELWTTHENSIGVHDELEHESCTQFDDDHSHQQLTQLSDHHSQHLQLDQAGSEVFAGLDQGSSTIATHLEHSVMEEDDAASIGHTQYSALPLFIDHQPICDSSITMENVHSGWISALSGEASSITASGDTLGHLIIWRHQHPNHPGPKERVVARDMSVWIDCEGFCVSMISCIVFDPHSSFMLWVADASHTITCAHITAKSAVIHKTRQVTHQSLGIPRHLRWTRDHSSALVLDNVKLTTTAGTGTGTGTSGGGGGGLLQSADGATDFVMEYYLHDTVAVVFACWPEPAHPPAHMSLVEVCLVLPALELLVTAGNTSELSVWDITTGQLLLVHKCEDRRFTSLTGVDVGFMTGGLAKIFTGHANGAMNEYLLKGPKTQHTEHVNGHHSASSTNNVTYHSATGARAGVTAEDNTFDRTGWGPSQMNSQSFLNFTSEMSPSDSGWDILDAVVSRHDQVQGDAALGVVTGLSERRLSTIVEVNNNVSNSIAKFPASGDVADTDGMSVRGAVSASSSLAESDMDRATSYHHHHFHRGKDRHTTGEDAGGAEQQRHDRRQERAQLMKQTNNSIDDMHSMALVQATCYCPLPVTHLFMSTLGGHLVSVHALAWLVVINLESNKVTMQVEVDKSLAHVSRMHYPDDDVNSDSLVLMLQSVTHIKIMDAIQGVILTQFDLKLPKAWLPVCSALWEVHVDMPATSADDAATQIVHRVIGLCAADKTDKQPGTDTPPGIFVFSDSLGFKLVSLNETTVDSYSALDNMILGCEAFSSGDSPVATAWSMRRVYLLRMNLQAGEPAVLKVLVYQVPHRKCRVVRAQCLTLLPRSRAHRILIVLSDGTSQVVTM